MWPLQVQLLAVAPSQARTDRAVLAKAPSECSDTRPAGHFTNESHRPSLLVKPQCPENAGVNISAS